MAVHQAKNTRCTKKTVKYTEALRERYAGTFRQKSQQTRYTSVVLRSLVQDEPWKSPVTFG